MQEYVCGLVRVGGLVLLVRKNHPAWQMGRLNGIGGHVAPDESPLDAMVREWREETGTAIPPPLWQEFQQLRGTTPDRTGSPWLVHFFRAVVDDLDVEPGQLNDSGEELVFRSLDVSTDPDWLHPDRAIANLAWLIPMAHLDPTYVEGVSVSEESGA